MRLPRFLIGLALLGVFLTTCAPAGPPTIEVLESFEAAVKAKNVVSNNSDTYTSYGRITNIISLTAAEYAALVTAGTTDPNTLYVAI